MVFITKVDRLPEEIDRKKLKKSSNQNNVGGSFEDALEAVVSVDAVEVTLSNEKKEQNSKDQKKKQQPAEEEQHKLDVKA